MLFSHKSISQEYIYQNFGVDDGLPSSEVYDTYQDKEGYIWFATDKGLSRYNGYEFENFNTGDGLTGNVVLRFYPQTNGQIWCYTFHNKSLFYFDEVFKGFKPYKYNSILTSNLIEGSIVKSLFLDSSSDLHVSGVKINGELIIRNDGKVENNFNPENSHLDSTDTCIMALMNYENSLITPFFIYTSDTSVYDTNFLYIKRSSKAMIVSKFADCETAVFMSDYIVEIKTQNQEIIPVNNNHSPLGLKVIDSTHFFVGYLFGGGKIIDKTGAIKNEFLKDKSITNFLIDHEGGYWFTTFASGVYYIENPSTIVCNAINAKSIDVYSLAKNSNQELLIGHKNGTISKFSNYRNPILIDLPKTFSYGFVEYDSINSNIYFYNGTGLKNQTSTNIIIAEYLLKLSEPNDNTIFASCPNGFYSVQDNQEIRAFPSPFRIHDVCVWNNDTIIASPTGVFKYNNGKYDSLSDQSDLFKYRSDDIDVNSNKNTLFVATQGAGVIVYTSTRIYNIKESDGLNSNVINEIHVENDSTIWACTNSGINRIIFKGDTISVTGISKKEGLLSNEVEDIEIINDTVWVGTKQGLCGIPKNKITERKIETPFFTLKEFLVNDRSREILANPILSHNENEIKLVLEGKSFSNKDNLYYKFRLNDDLNWSTTKNRAIYFSSLLPGKYVFEAKMCIDNQICGQKTIVYAFTIQAPFWKTGWFAILSLCGFGLLIYLFFKIRVLTYNKDIIREFIRLMVRRLKKNETFFSFREDGKDIRIKTHEISYIKSAGNYIDVHTENKTYTIRMNIGKFLDNVPDKLEYVRLHRSYIVRIDKITSKSKNEVQLTNDIKIPVSLNHHKSLKEVVF